MIPYWIAMLITKNVRLMRINCKYHKHEANRKESLDERFVYQLFKPNDHRSLHTTFSWLNFWLELKLLSINSNVLIVKYEDLILNFKVLSLILSEKIQKNIWLFWFEAILHIENFSKKTARFMTNLFIVPQFC